MQHIWWHDNSCRRSRHVIEARHRRRCLFVSTLPYTFPPQPVPTRSSFISLVLPSPSISYSLPLLLLLLFISSPHPQACTFHPLNIYRQSDELGCVWWQWRTVVMGVEMILQLLLRPRLLVYFCTEWCSLIAYSPGIPGLFCGWMSVCWRWAVFYMVENPEMSWWGRG